MVFWIKMGGRAVAHNRIRYEHCMNALAAEALVCYDGMQLAWERGMQRLILEIDCQVLISPHCWFMR